MKTEPIKLADLVGPQNVKKSPYKKYDTVFVLGAGFSKHAGFPLATGFGKKLRENHERNWGKFNDEQRKTFYRLLDEFKIGSPENEEYDFERALTSLYQAQRFDDFNVICLGINATLDGCASVFGGKQEYEPYFHFLDYWRSLDAAVITFNYDTVLETTHYDLRHWLDRHPEQRIVGTSPIHTKSYDLWFDYGLPNVRPYNALPSGVKMQFERKPVIRPFLKLHGGMNWWVCQEEKQVAYIADNSNNTHSGKCPRCKAPVRSGIIPPSAEKDINVFEGLWDHAGFLTKNCKHICIIGYSFPKTDKYPAQLLQEAFAVNLPKVTVVTKADDPQEATRYWQDKFKDLFHFDLPDVSIFCDGFEGFMRTQI